MGLISLFSVHWITLQPMFYHLITMNRLPLTGLGKTGACCTLYCTGLLWRCLVDPQEMLDPSMLLE